MSTETKGEFWKGKRALVTGAAGFIGSHLVEELVGAGASVRAFVRYTSRGDVGMLEDLEGAVFDEVEIFYGDLRDKSAVEKALEDVDVVFHLGAVISIPYSYLNPEEVVHVNVMGTLSVLQSALKFKIPRVVHVSTSEVYGTAQYVPIDENHPKRGQSPYSASKIGADELARSFYLTYGLPVRIVRPFNTFGPRQSQRAVISTIIVQALKAEEIHLGNLDTVRDFTFVKDTVRGLVKAAERDETVGQEINLGTGKGWSIGETARIVLDVLGVDKKIVVERDRFRPEKSEVYRLISDNSKAKELLSWSPRYSFEEGLKITVDWFKEHLELYRREVP
ncbi:MAG: SDR family NAD(P)-dependent oxidoreductase [Candidatus Hydrothermae bacterium]|nr:SDR family NAD(P)-dependent oxidoreductase [Candidatus Hydrothermae bacterium]